MSTHEHAPLTRREESELRLIGQRLWRDGVRLDRHAGREWPWQVGAVLAAASGGLMLGSAAWMPPGTLAALDAVLGALLISGAMVAGPTAARRWVLRTATAVQWRVTARLGSLRRPRPDRQRRRWTALRRVR